MFNLSSNTLFIWLISVIVVGIIAGLTYFYSKNKKYTFIATLLSIYVITFILIATALSETYAHQFIGRLDPLGVPYIHANTGWTQLINGWSMWILPVMVSVLLTVFITLALVRQPKKIVATAEPKTDISHEPTTSFTQMTERLGKDTLKNTLTDSVEKLSDALLSISAQEHKIAELTAQLHKSGDNVSNEKKQLEEQISEFQLKLNSLTVENEQLTTKLENCKSELELSHQMFNKLLEYKQNEEGSS